MIVIDTYKVLDQLEQLVEESKKFMGFVKLDEDEFFMLVGKLRASLPEDVRRAGKITENTDRIMEAAQIEAEKALDDSKREAERLIADSKVQSDRLLENARRDAARMIDDSQNEAAHLTGTARAQADQAIMEAHNRSATLTDQSEISRLASVQARDLVDQAEADARMIVQQARAEADEVRSGAEGYAHELLTKLEKHLEDSLRDFDSRFGNALTIVQRGRLSLEQGMGPTSDGKTSGAPSEPPGKVPSGAAGRQNGAR